MPQKTPPPACCAPWAEQVAALERRAIAAALHRPPTATSWRRRGLLGISRATLYGQTARADRRPA
ncbi:MAG: hypothetical protein V9G22_13515 [Ottowia sp.]